MPKFALFLKIFLIAQSKRTSFLAFLEIFFMEILILLFIGSTSNFFRLEVPHRGESQASRTYG